MTPYTDWFRPRRTREPDLLAESEHAEGAAYRARVAAYGVDVGRVPVSVTDAWPDPYGPDPVVFGGVPRVREWQP